MDVTSVPALAKREKSPTLMIVAAAFAVLAAFSGCAQSRNAQAVSSRPLTATPRSDAARPENERPTLTESRSQQPNSQVSAAATPDPSESPKKMEPPAPDDPPPISAPPQSASKTDAVKAAGSESKEATKEAVEERTSRNQVRAPQNEEQTAQAKIERVTPRQIVEEAAAYYRGVEKYSCRITRQERVGKKLMPKETMEMHFRQQPRSVYYKWINEENFGRECVFVVGANNDHVVTRGGKGDPFFMVGRTVSVDPNGILARNKSRYSITESGLDNLVGRFLDALKAIDNGKDEGFQVSYQGQTTRDEHAHPLHHIRQKIAVGADPLFPQGGVRDWYFHPETKRLIVMEAVGAEGEKHEYYFFDRFFENETLGDSQFDPEKLWPKGA